jgi:Recombinase
MLSSGLVVLVAAGLMVFNSVVLLPALVCHTGRYACKQFFAPSIPVPELVTRCSFVSSTALPSADSMFATAYLGTKLASGPGMPQVERIREDWLGAPTPDDIRRKAETGWRPVAIVWERDVDPAERHLQMREVDIPYGLKIAADAKHLEENPTEHQVLMLTMEWIVQDKRLSQVATELNNRGFRTRAGFAWNPASVFELLPRLIEAGPRIFTSDEWIERRRHLGAALQH